MHISYGADPEFFFEQNGAIIGSEKILANNPIKGLIIDGVQAEMNPPAANSIKGLESNIKAIFTRLQAKLNDIKDVQVSFKSFVDVPRAELDSLSDSSRVLGCKPSLNVYMIPPMAVDAKTYTKRSTGGHYHFGLSHPIYNPAIGVDERKRLIPILDMILGNTCVLIDRDPNQAERRQVYGRPGEYRLTEYGLEYRTLSNFWLQHPGLMHFVMELGKLSVGILNSGLDPSSTSYLSGRKNLEKEIYDATGNIGVVVKAIMHNNYDLALDNFNRIFTAIYSTGYLHTYMPNYFPSTL